MKFSFELPELLYLKMDYRSYLSSEDTTMVFYQVGSRTGPKDNMGSYLLEADTRVGKRSGITEVPSHRPLNGWWGISCMIGSLAQPGLGILAEPP